MYISAVNIFDVCMSGEMSFVAGSCAFGCCRFILFFCTLCANVTFAFSPCVYHTSTAPEIFAPEGYGLSSDVYSFGILMWETCLSNHSEAKSHDNPLAGLEPSLAVEKVPFIDSPLLLLSAKKLIFFLQLHAK